MTNLPNWNLKDIYVYANTIMKTEELHYMEVTVLDFVYNHDDNYYEVLESTFTIEENMFYSDFLQLKMESENFIKRYKTVTGFIKKCKREYKKHLGSHNTFVKLESEY